MNKIKIKIRFIMLITSLLVSMQLNADTLGLRVSAGVWNPVFSGNIKDGVNETVDIKSDLYLDDKSQTFIYLYFEHPVPLIPNVRIGQTSLNTTGSGALNKTFTYEDKIFPQGNTIATNANLDHTELTAYWSILDNFINLDIGLNIKSFDGEIKLSTAGVTAITSFSDTVPLLYTAAAFDFPLTGLSIGIEASYLSAIKASLTDISTYIRYESPFFFGAEFGFRTLEFESDVSSIQSKFTAKGSYLSAFLHF